MLTQPASLESKEDRAKKRKAQLRNAQLSVDFLPFYLSFPLPQDSFSQYNNSTYRERKERYTKALEEHVAEATANEADLHREIGELRETVKKLAQFIQDQGVQIPDEIKLPVSLSPAPEKALADEWLSHQSYQGASGIGNETYPIMREDSPRVELISDPNNNLRLGDLDSLAVGMEFVLTLERPCVNHLYPNDDSAHEVGGHALTFSGQLAPLYAKSVFESSKAHETFRREVPEQSLFSLLTLSSELCPESEITPIEAWHSIRSQPLFGGMRAQNLWRLVERLRDAATCHGFGAVINRESFEKFMFEIMILDNAL
ncbi:hypothetical protein F5Y08DRAFT_341742 [Xylaria arbuscula]|nr:hypothetical protein F5Y08DRAFT_341742 [Xylaria arbuscula]